MRTINADTTIGLLLFDEPSASLDPTAEHGDIDRPAFLCLLLISINFQTFLNDCEIFVEARP